MRYVQFGLLCEGSTDSAALPPLIEKAVSHLIYSDNVRAAFEWQVIPAGASTDEQITSAVEADVFDVLIVHRDGASHASSTRTSISNLGGVPLVPVRELEAWLIVDPEAFCRAAKAAAERLPDNLPTGRNVERVTDPKGIMNGIVEALVRRPLRGNRYGELERFLEIVAGEIDFSRLRVLPAFIHFLDDLHSALGRLGWPFR